MHNTILLSAGKKERQKKLVWPSFFFFCVPQLYLWGSPLWVRFLGMWPFSNLTIEVVMFHLHGWSMLGVFLLPAFTCLGHECQDLLSPCDGMHVCTDWTSVYALIQKSFLEMESEPMLTPKGKKILYWKILLGGESNLWRCIKQDSEPNTLPMSYSDLPPCMAFLPPLPPHPSHPLSYTYAPYFCTHTKTHIHNHVCPHLSKHTTTSTHLHTLYTHDHTFCNQKHTFYKQKQTF